MARPGLTTHRKFRRLARALGSAVIARGSLELMWETCYESGDDVLGTAEDIESLLEWSGEPGVLAHALAGAGAPERASGFIEPIAPESPVYRVHDLWHHAPDYVKKRRERELARQRRTAPNGAERRETADTDRRTAPDGEQWPPSLDKQPGDARTPSPAPSPAPSHEEGDGGADAPQAPSADAVALMQLWNATMDGKTTAKGTPMPTCLELTAKRRRHVKARLSERPLNGDGPPTSWETVIARAAASRFCRGHNDRGWVATFDWLVGSADTAVKLLEGKYDGDATDAPPSAGEMRRAMEIRRALGACPHRPACSALNACLARIVRERLRAPADQAPAATAETADQPTLQSDLWTFAHPRIGDHRERQFFDAIEVVEDSPERIVLAVPSRIERLHVAILGEAVASLRPGAALTVQPLEEVH